MKLKAKLLKIAAKEHFVVLINEKDASTLHIEPSSRVKIKKGNKTQVAYVDFSYDNQDIKRGEIGLFIEVAKNLDVKNKAKVEVTSELRPFSIKLIKKKLDKHELNKEEILWSKTVPSHLATNRS